MLVFECPLAKFKNIYSGESSRNAFVAFVIN